MLCNKTVTVKKLEANRENAKRSTGPRTGRGKYTSKFNAVTLGLFAKHVVISGCDGYGSEKEFRKLVDGLQQEFQPVGMFEEWLVAKVAESMWRLRRATRSENGSVRKAAIWDSGPPEDHRVSDAFAMYVGTLAAAEEEIRTRGTISQRTYAQVLPLVEEQRRSRAQSAIDDSPIDATIDDEFVGCLEDRKKLLESYLDGDALIADDRESDHLASCALLPVEDLDKVLRYENRMQRQLDWALQRLLEAQQRRTESGRLRGPSLVPAIE